MKYLDFMVFHRFHKPRKKSLIGACLLAFESFLKSKRNQGNR